MKRIERKAIAGATAGEQLVLIGAIALAGTGSLSALGASMGRSIGADAARSSVALVRGAGADGTTGAGRTAGVDPSAGRPEVLSRQAGVAGTLAGALRDVSKVDASVHPAYIDDAISVFEALSAEHALSPEWLKRNKVSFVFKQSTDAFASPNGVKVENLAGNAKRVTVDVGIFGEQGASLAFPDSVAASTIAANLRADKLGPAILDTRQTTWLDSTAVRSERNQKVAADVNGALMGYFRTDRSRLRRHSLRVILTEGDNTRAYSNGVHVAPRWSGIGTDLFVDVGALSDSTRGETTMTALGQAVEGAAKRRHIDGLGASYRGVAVAVDGTIHTRLPGFEADAASVLKALSDEQLLGPNALRERNVNIIFGGKNERISTTNGVHVERYSPDGRDVYVDIETLFGPDGATLSFPDKIAAATIARELASR